MTATGFLESRFAQVDNEGLRRAVEADRRAGARADAERRMRLAGHTPTPKNLAILDILEETRGQHPRAQDIHERLRRRHPEAHLHSLYPVLRALEGAGLVRARRYGGRTPTRYDTRLDAHVDVLCTCCGAITEVMATPTAEPTRGEVRSGMVRAGDTRRGLCRSCSAGVAAPGAA